MLAGTYHSSCPHASSKPRGLDGSPHYRREIEPYSRLLMLHLFQVQQFTNPQITLSHFLAIPSRNFSCCRNRREEGNHESHLLVISFFFFFPFPHSPKELACLLSPLRPANFRPPSHHPQPFIEVRLSLQTSRPHLINRCTSRTPVAQLSTTKPNRSRS